MHDTHDAGADDDLGLVFLSERGGGHADYWVMAGWKAPNGSHWPLGVANHRSLNEARRLAMTEARETASRVLGRSR